MLADYIFRSSMRWQATIAGFSYGIVVRIDDPENAGRIKLKMPWHDVKHSTDWVPKAAGWNGPLSGETFTIPEPGDVVFVYFLAGDINNPAYGAILHSISTPVPSDELIDQTVPDNPAAKAGYKKRWAAPINFDPEMAGIGGAGGRRDIWRDRHGWKLLFEHVGRRLRFWMQDFWKETAPRVYEKEDTQSYEMDMKHAEEDSWFKFTTPKRHYVHIIENADQDQIILTLENGMKLEVNHVHTDDQNFQEAWLRVDGGTNVHCYISELVGDSYVKAQANDGKDYVEIHNQRGITLRSTSDVFIKADGHVTIEAGGAFNVSANYIFAAAAETHQISGNLIILDTKTTVNVP